MKKIFTCTFLLYSILSFTQQKRFTLNWDKTQTFSTENSSIEVPSFNKENLSFNDQDGLLFVSQWDFNEEINQSSVRITNVSYSNVSKTELKDLDINTIPNKIRYELKSVKAREQNFAYLEVSPIINDNGIYKKVNSFTVNYNTNTGPTSANTRAQNVNGIFNSVLSQGQWYRFYVDRTGVFRITRGFLNSLGVNTNNLDPRNIRIYGQGGEILPLRNSVFYPLDLVENAIQVIGEEDGSFDNNDSIIFYAEGPTGFNQENNTNINPYTDRAHYFINIGSPGNGKRIQPLEQPNGSITTTIDTFHDYQFQEVDDVNLVSLGRRWFSNPFDIESNQTFEFEFPNIVTSDPINLRVFTAATSDIPTTMQLNVNGVAVDNFSYPPINDLIFAFDRNFIGDVSVNSSDIEVNLEYNNNGNPGSIAYLDYISIEARRALTYVGSQFLFRNNDVPTLSGIGEYVIDNAARISEIWDITDEHNITSFANNTGEEIRFTAQLGEQRTYIAVDPSDFFEPLRDNQSLVNNQNLKGTVFLNDQGGFEDIDYIIVTRQDMLSQAERLAEINRRENDLNVRVVELQDIYNEFSSGNQDISGIRNFVRYVYENASSPENRIRYLCLFGDGSFDPKERIPNNTNVVPTFNTLNSFSVTSSFVSDDFYGVMDENEGTLANSDRLDIAVGRILADTPDRARTLVDKVDIYYQDASFGNWRNNYITVSDDVDEEFETILQGTTDVIADDISANIPSVNVVKIHSDSFQQQSSAGGDRYPDVNQTIFDEMEEGALVVNYFGHGGEDGLADEFIFNRLDAEEVNNVCRLTCFLTVTCEYTRFDNPLRPTAGETLFWNEEAGAIALLTTTREIFVGVGTTMNIVVRDHLYPNDFNDLTTIAEALRLTKIDPRVANISQRRLVFYIGDPALTLAFPEPNIRITEVNDTPIQNNPGVLRGLDRANMRGEVTDALGNLLASYNGILTVTVFDKDINKSTLGNDGVRVNGQLAILDYVTLGEVLFRGEVSVQNGVFDFDFVVPRDVVISEGNGKISMYTRTTDFSEDQTGANFQVRFGGLNEDAPDDTTGPTVSVFLNDENFVSGGITNESPTLIAQLFDENGINTASGIGHDIVAILDNDEVNPFILNDFYQAELDDFQRGRVAFPLRDLEPGLHTITVIAFDVYNNSSRSEIQFEVRDEDEELVIENVLNYPNPLINYTEFWFNHNSSETLDVSVQIFTVSGKLVRTLNGQTSGGGKVVSNLSRDIVWDGRDDFGAKIGKGVYVYKLTVRSNQLNTQVEKFEKLVIL